MAGLVRHKGFVADTGTRCTVVFRELPKEPEYCLVFEADSLPEYFRDAVASVVNREGQTTRDLYEVLHRSTLPNGENMLMALHTQKLMTRKRTSDVIMTPTSESKIRLDELNSQIRDVDAGIETKPVENNIQHKLNPYAEAAEQLEQEEASGIAVRLLAEASDLEHEVERKREQAYNLRPELRPEQEPLVAPGAPEPTVAEMDDITALQLFEELQERFGGIPMEPEKNASDTEFTLELSGISQRKANEAIKEAWRKANPDKVKDK